VEKSWFETRAVSLDQTKKYVHEEFGNSYRSRCQCHTGAKIFQKGFEKISKENSSTLGWLSQSDAKETEEEIQDSASACIVPHWGKIFLSSKKLEKFIQRYTLGQIFPFLSGEKLEKFERVIRNGPREGVSPDIDRNGPREGVRPKDCGNGPRGGVSPKICRNGPREGVRPKDCRNGPREGVRPKDC
jgi:hypothetical protein